MQNIVEIHLVILIQVYYLFIMLQINFLFFLRFTDFMNRVVIFLCVFGGSGAHFDTKFYSIDMHVELAKRVFLYNQKLCCHSLPVLNGVAHKKNTRKIGV